LPALARGHSIAGCSDGANLYRLNLNEDENVNAAKVLLAAAAALLMTSVQAQDASPSSNEPRLPKGIRGLEGGQAKPPSANWLLDAKDDQERFRRLQVYSGGTYEQMWQVGYRYQQVYHAIVDKNWELGTYHWGKLRDVLNVALMKRPNRTPNAEAMFLDKTWKQLEEALRARNSKQAESSFLAQRGACMACHVAEGMPFLNDTPIFRDTAAFSSTPAASR
jgi:hypothetical protein